jgi:hypothetical protein
VAFEEVFMHDVVAASGHAFAVASVDTGSDTYYHPRADGTNALSMIVDELVPAVDAVVGASIPRAIVG